MPATLTASPALQSAPEPSVRQAKDHTAFPSTTSSLEAPNTKRIAPGLVARLYALDAPTRNIDAARWRQEGDIGRLSDELIEHIDRFWLQQKDAIEVQRRGKRWSGPPVRVEMPSGKHGVRLDGGGAVPSDAEHSMLESDVSSIISISERMVASDTEEEVELHDSQKYRMPDVGKTRLHMRTKQPLSPGPRAVPRSPRSPTAKRSSVVTPTTPRKMDSPVRVIGSPRAVNGNGSTMDYGSDNELFSTGVSCAGSIYSIGRSSFTSQLSQLTGIQLPDATSLSSRISSIPTSTAAGRALSDAADQIQIWIKKAAEVLSGIDAEDDVEWAAAGGRDGLGDVDRAISKFESLVNVYVIAIEQLQMRTDASDLSRAELENTVRQMEGILSSWGKIKNTLRDVKEQVEIAMEWQELWNSVLGQIGQEMEGLHRLVFEMEEKRHSGALAQSPVEGKDGIDINELVTIVEEKPGHSRKAPASNRFSLPGPFSPSSPIQPSTELNSSDADASLLALFAKMQPMRASLDFLPMRLSQFHCRGNPLFPTACLELEGRRTQLEAQWKKLEADAESLRRELGEDRWVLVFRNAGRQALKMCESIRRSEIKLREALDTNEQLPSTAKKIESYEAKKMHYGPAIERVLAIIDRGILDRLTVNGEILRLQSDMRRRWSTLQADIRDMDVVLADIDTSSRNQQLRDSISTILSNDRSVASSRIETPGSSPASSVVPATRSRTGSFQETSTPTPLINGKVRQASYTKSAKATPTPSRLPSASSIPKRTPLSRSSASVSTEVRGSPIPSPSLVRPASRIASYATATPLPPAVADNRPRWTPVGKASALGQDFPPLSAFEPSPYAKTPIEQRVWTPKSAPATSQLPSRGSGRMASSPAVSASTARTKSSLQTYRQVSLPMSSPPGRASPLALRAANVATARSTTPLMTKDYVSPYSQKAIRAASGPATAAARRSNLAKTPMLATDRFPDGANVGTASAENDGDVDGEDADTEAPPTAKNTRPSSAMARDKSPATAASERRSSVLPRAYSRMDGAVAGADKPRWR